MKQDWIGVLDCNNFFVSCERLFRPDLKGKPVIVLSSNDGCIVARSQEIKDKNIPMGVPYFQVKDSLTALKTTCFSSNLTLYRDISRRVFEAMREELAEIEVYSIDEAFFCFRNVTKEESTMLALKLKDKVEQQIGIPVSIGLGPSKTIAKYANDRAKKTTGVAAFDKAVWLDATGNIPLGEIWGVGLKTAHRFRDHQLFTVADYLSVDSSRCQALFGVVGMRLAAELSGNVIPFSITTTPQKSIVSSRSFKTISTDKSVIKDALSYHISEIASELRTLRQKAKYIRIFILPSRHGDFLLQGASVELSLESPLNDTLALLKVAHGLLESVFVAHVPYQKVGVAVGSFVPETVEQLDLFGAGQPMSSGVLMSVVDTLNHKFGHETLKLGSRLQGATWKAKAELRSPGYTTKWTDIKTVKA